MPGSWWWCLTHKRAEDDSSGCPPDQRMGPYDSAQDAEHWRERVEARNEKWDREDREWEGEED